MGRAVRIERIVAFNTALPPQPSRLDARRRDRDDARLDAIASVYACASSAAAAGGQVGHVGQQWPRSGEPGDSPLVATLLDLGSYRWMTD
jgi:hypothetical protein